MGCRAWDSPYSDRPKWQQQMLRVATVADVLDYKVTNKWGRGREMDWLSAPVDEGAPLPMVAAPMAEGQGGWQSCRVMMTLQQKQKQKQKWRQLLPVMFLGSRTARRRRLAG